MIDSNSLQIFMLTHLSSLTSEKGVDFTSERGYFLCYNYSHNNAGTAWLQAKVVDCWHRLRCLQCDDVCFSSYNHSESSISTITSSRI